jgi:hypothetical protein
MLMMVLVHCVVSVVIGLFQYWCYLCFIMLLVLLVHHVIGVASHLS